MGLGIHIGQGDIDNLGEYLGQIEMEEHEWLQKNGFLILGETGHFPAPVESLPYFDDVVLSHEQVLNIKTRFEQRKSELLRTLGFQSTAADKLGSILETAIKKGQGLSTCAD